MDADYKGLSNQIQHNYVPETDNVKFATDGGCVVHTDLGPFQVARSKLDVPDYFRTPNTVEDRDIYIEKNEYETKVLEVPYIQYVHEVQAVPISVTVQRLNKKETSANHTITRKKPTAAMSEKRVPIPQGVRTVEVPMEVECDYPPTLKYVDKTINVNRKTVVEKPVVKENIIEVPTEIERPVEVIKENIIYHKVPKFNVIERKISMSEYEVIKKSIDNDRCKVAEARLNENLEDAAKSHEFNISDEVEIDIQVEPYSKSDWELNEEMTCSGIKCCSVSPSLQHSRRVIRLLDEPLMEDYVVKGDTSPQLLTRAGFVDLNNFADKGLNEFMFPPFKNQIKDMPIDNNGMVDLKKAFEKELGGMELTEEVANDIRRNKRTHNREAEGR